MGYGLFLFYPVLLPPESLGLNSYLLSPIVLAQVARETTKTKGGGGGGGGGTNYGLGYGKNP